MYAKKYYLGIDGGGTKTAFAICDEDNNLVYYNELGSSSLDTVSFKNFEKLINEGVAKYEGKVDAIFAGIGGISNDLQIEKVKKVLKNLKVSKKETKVDAGNDVINALYGSLDGKNGLVLIAGTGSVCFGKNGDKYHRAGGYCYQEGDGGSSYYLGYRALQHLARVLDKREKASSFSNKLIEVTGAHDYSSLANYFINAKRNEIAALARVVTSSSNNKYAKKIIKDGVKEVLSMIKTVYNELNFTEVSYFSIIGGLGNAPTLYKELLLEGLKKISNNLIFVEMKHEAYIGSILKAKELI